MLGRSRYGDRSAERETDDGKAFGCRDYDEDDEIAVRRIQMLSDAGLKLDAIRRILPCVIDEKPNFHPCNDLRALLRVDRQKIDERIATMQSSREVLSRYLDDLD
ncbi:MerR family DNA-binding protein [Acetobacter sp. DmW_136]|uniref:MerR family DNA-binding protein n=1 Tax=Acetobacter sp. DmW_136 TaxID=2591091 RepID=UPI00351B7E3F